MDRNNKTDQFFRENLDQIEFQPSDQAWEKVHETIKSRSVTPWSTYLKVAAGFALLITVGLLFFPKENQKLYTYGEVISPQPMEIAAIDASTLRRPEQIAVAPIVESQVGKPQVIQDLELQVQRNPEKESLELTTISDFSMASLEVKEPVLKGVSEPTPVKITYMTSNSSGEVPIAIEEQDTAKTKLLDRMKYFAQNVSPVDLLTDLRMAKEELLENGFRKN